MLVILEFDDVEIWYEVDGVSICHDPYGVAGVDPARRRPAGDYLVVKGARLDRIQPAEGVDA
jgi:hypothetical protein